MSINWTKFSSILFFFKDLLKRFDKILFELKASEPPFSITGFPDLKHKHATSDVTFGLLS